jgi:hypothetical protein
MYNNGDTFDGDFKNGYIEGFGVFQKGSCIYKGEWKNNLAHGLGECKHVDGSVYKGSWDKGKKVFGTLYFPNGDVYEGNFLNQDIHGRGIMKYNDYSVYEGDFVLGQKHGYGIKTMTNGNRYEGFWKFDKREGFGTIYYLCGDVVKGEFENGKMKNK